MAQETAQAPQAKQVEHRPHRPHRPHTPNPGNPGQAEQAERALRITVDDGGTAVAGLHEALEADWLCRVCERSAPPELAIQVIRHLEPFGRTYRWLALGLPHLVIRFADDAVYVGPIVSASGAPCHGCEALALVEAQPDLPWRNAARFGKQPRSECTPVTLLASSVAAHFVRHFRIGTPGVHHTQVVIPVQKGLACAIPRLVTITTHPECGCAV